MAAALLAGCVLAGASAKAGPNPLEMIEVASGVFVHTGVHSDINPGNRGDISNIGFVIGAEGVAVIDTGNTRALGERLRAAIRARTDLPISYVVNTHVHPDHIFGNAAFAGDDPEFVGHAKLEDAMMSKAPYYLQTLRSFVGEEAAEEIDLVPPTLTVAAGESRELDLGGRRLRVTGYPTAHTDNDVTVFDTATSTLWTGDLLFVRRTPSIDGSLKGWLAVIESLETVEAARAVPGHGPASAAWPEALRPERGYFEILLRDIRKILAENGTIEEAIATAGQEEAGHWLLFEEYNARNVGASFAELEWE